MRVSVCLHDALHGFPADKGTGVEILDLKLVQELASLYQAPLFLVFLCLCKSYDTVDCGFLLTTLEGYVAGPHMCRLLAVFWDKQEVFTRQNGYHGLHFRAIREDDQGGLISPTRLILLSTMWCRTDLH